METIKMEVHTNNSQDLVTVKNEIDIKEDDSSNWKMWCRLCAKDGHDMICIYDTQSPDSHPDIVLAIETHFSSHVRIEEEHLPKSVCSECYYFLKELLSFEKRIDEAQELFTSMMPFKNTNIPSKNEMLDERFISEQTLQRLPDLNCQDMFEINGRNFERNPLEIVDNEAEMKSLEINNLCNNPEEILKEIEDNCSDTISESDQSDSEQSNDPSTFRKVKTRIRKKYECIECSRKFSNDSDYKLHLKHVHNEDIQLAEHKCDQCSKVFNRKAGLKSHINSIHIKVRPFLCDECGRAFGTLANLNEHKLTHSDYAPYVCNFCNKGFKAQKWLKKHMDMHDPNGHICTICNAHLKSNLTLKRHMVIHSNEKPFKCDVCGYSCKRAKSLKVHLISHAGLKPYACDICFRSFSSGANCLNHKKKSHPDEMAAQEQTGAQKYAQNVPNLAFLKALAQSSKDLKPIVSRRSILNNDAKKS